MAKNQMVWEGMTEFQEALRRLPEECQADAAKEIEGGVNTAYATIKSVYLAHQFTGNLAKRLTIAKVRGGLELRSLSPIAWLFDNGSKVRHWATGTKRSTGKMWGKTTPTHIFARTVAQQRRRLTQIFADILLRHGATKVTDE